MFIKNITVGTITVLTFMLVALIVPVSVSTDDAIGVSTVSAFGSSEDGGCCGDSDPKPKPDPKPPKERPAICQYLNADKVTLPYGGGDVTLTWASSRANSATLTPTGSSVAVNGSKTVLVTDDTTFVFNVSNGDGSDSCRISIDVQDPVVDPLPSCDAFSATPSAFTAGGGTATLSWATTDATTVSINNGVGTVAEDGSKDVSITGDITYTLTAQNSVGTVTCPASIVVEPPVVVDSITCGKNVTFTASTQSLPKGGGNVDFTWTTTGLDSVSFTGLTSTSLSGNESKQITSDQTVTLIGTKDGKNVSCPLPIDVRTGGGHSSSPRCSIDISDEKITKGQEITLTWDTSKVREVKITDNHGNTLLDTKDKDEFDGSMKLKPTKDTEYTLLSKRGTRERTCKVEVDITNNVSVHQTRTHDPRVAGISLTQVPYTGFEAGPAMTALFYIILAIWGLFVAYLLVIRRDSLAGISLAGSHGHSTYTDMSTDVDSSTSEPVAEEYVDSVIASTATPTNLPIAPAVVGYQTYASEIAADESIEMTEIENRAHAQKVLLSSDAMRFFMSTTENDGTETRNQKLDSAIERAKGSFPSEDGWMALDLARLESLIVDKKASEEVDEQETPITAGSLAETIIEGNVVSAYQMIAHRPMIALADAAADLDAVYRSRKGENTDISNMLKESTKNVSTEQLESAINALTGALDGTYADEASAVKMAILKSIKAVA